MLIATTELVSFYVSRQNIYAMSVVTQVMHSVAVSERGSPPEGTRPPSEEGQGTRLVLVFSARAVSIQCRATLKAYLLIWSTCSVTCVCSFIRLANVLW